MKRSRRWPVNAMAAVTLLFFLATMAAIGTASYWQSIRFDWSQGRQYHQVGVGSGNFYVLAGGSGHDAVDYSVDHGFCHGSVDDFAARHASFRRMADRDWRVPGLEWSHWTPDTFGPS